MKGLLLNVLAAAGVAYYFGLGLNEILPSLQTWPVLAHRGQLLKLKGGIDIYDDSYNSNPAALQQVLKSLGRLRPGENCCSRRYA